MSLAQDFITAVVAFAVLCAGFRLLELTRPKAKRQLVIRAGFWTDLTYWLLTPLTTRLFTRVAIVAAIVPIAWLAYGRIDGEQIRQGFGPLSQWPLVLQAFCILLVSDFVSYWLHRAFHTGRLWRFHAVHHSPVVLDWLATVRVHPINDAVMRVAAVIPVVALGFTPTALAGAVPVLTFMAILIHANVTWDWGPLRSVIASPRFHRWHHTSDEEGRDKNFAGVFPLWDILFGTYYMPRNRVPERFGADLPVPPGLIGQWMFPFKRDP